jgi:hypothetical protein
VTLEEAELRRCVQCSLFWPLTSFYSLLAGRYVKQCAECRVRYRRWGRLSPEERRQRMPTRERSGIGYVAHLVRSGPMPVSFTDMASCPDACAFRDRGCFAEYGGLYYRWRNLTEEQGRSWTDFCADVHALPAGTFWQHNIAGDLPGRGDDLDVKALALLVRANAGRRGFTFTAKPLRTPAERKAVSEANAAGFTINLSAHSLEHADELAELGIGPVAVVLPHKSVPDTRTPAGREIFVCLQESRLSCEECRLCAQADRSVLIGFRATGSARGLVSDLVQLRRKTEEAG